MDPRLGLPKLRQSWIARREARKDERFTQMYYARRGEWEVDTGLGVRG